MLTPPGSFTAEQRELSRAARGVFARTWPTAAAQAFGRGGADEEAAALLVEMARLGWLGLAIPEAEGGTGGALEDLAVIYHEAGRALAPVTFAAAATAARLVHLAGTQTQRREHLVAMVEGRRRGVLALAEPSVHHDPASVTTLLVPGRDGLVLTGEKWFVHDAATATHLLVVARPATGDEPVVAVVPAARRGVERAALQTFAGDRQYAVHLDQVPVEPHEVLAGGSGRDVAEARRALERVLQEATALQAVEMAAGARRAAELAAAHVKERVQFGRPLAAFQAVQHHLADVATDVDAAELAAWQAVGTLERGEAARMVSIAKVAVGEAYRRATLTAFQLCGGTGYVTDHPLHLYADRAKAADLELGSADHHLERLADLAVPRSRSI